jgi:hypothetical protein
LRVRPANMGRRGYLTVSRSGQMPLGPHLTSDVQLLSMASYRKFTAEFIISYFRMLLRKPSQNPKSRAVLDADGASRIVDEPPPDAVLQAPSPPDCPMLNSEGMVTHGDHCAGSFTSFGDESPGDARTAIKPYRLCSITDSTHPRVVRSCWHFKGICFADLTFVTGSL